MASSRVTIADLARNLGLDKSSVSLALRGSGRVSAATRQRVRAAAQRFGYRPNLAARQLASPGTHIVALVLPPSFAPLFHGVVVATLESVARQAAAAGMFFCVLTTDQLDADPTDLERHALAASADGLLLWGETDTEVTARVAASGRPTVVIDPSDPSFSTYQGAAVRVDNAGGAAALTQHLLDQGARHLLFIQQQRHHLGHQERSDGARRQWLQSRPLEDFSFCLLDELADSTLCSFAQLEAPAILCSNDYCAMEIWHRLARHGIGVPTQMLLAGFDGEAFGSLIGLTTAVFDGERLGKAAFEILMQRLQAAPAPAESVTIPVEIRVGASTQRRQLNPQDSTASF
jgi:DNA-binding LacI/PurR family transcriptional regulator